MLIVCITPDHRSIQLDFKNANEVQIVEVRFRLLTEHYILFESIGLQQPNYLPKFVKDEDIVNQLNPIFILDNIFAWDYNFFMRKYTYYTFPTAFNIKLTLTPIEFNPQFIQKQITIQIPIFEHTSHDDMLAAIQDMLYYQEKIPLNKIVTLDLSLLQQKSCLECLIESCRHKNGIILPAKLLVSSVCLTLSKLNSNFCYRIFTYHIREEISKLYYKNLPTDKRLFQIENYSPTDTIDDLKLFNNPNLNFTVLRYPEAKECTELELCTIAQELIDDQLKLSKSHNYSKAYNVLCDRIIKADDKEYKINLTIFALQSHPDGLFYKLLAHNWDFETSKYIELDFNQSPFNKHDKALLHKALNIIIKRSFKIAEKITPDILPVLATFTQYFQLFYHDKVAGLLENEYVSAAVAISVL